MDSLHIDTGDHLTLNTILEDIRVLSIWKFN